ncbi:hypothetical protein J2X66_004398 [Pseudomonas sp. 3296]|nr:hypothetical protein [Pseudomonas sp. 3296]
MPPLHPSKDLGDERTNNADIRYQTDSESLNFGTCLRLVPNFQHRSRTTVGIASGGADTQSEAQQFLNSAMQHL